MPENRGFLPALSKGLELAIPLMIHKQKLDAQKNRLGFDVSRANANLDLQYQTLQQKIDQAKEKAATDTIKTKISAFEPLFKQAIEQGDFEAYQNIAPQMEKLAGITLPKMQYQGGMEEGEMPLPYSLPKIKPKEFKPEGSPKTLEAIIAQGAMNDPTKALELKERLIKAQKSAKTGNVPEDVKLARQIVLKFNRALDPATQLLLSMGVVDDKTKELLSQKTGIPEEVRPAYDKALQRLNKFYGLQTPSKSKIGKDNVTHEYIPGKGLVPK